MEGRTRSGLVQAVGVRGLVLAALFAALTAALAYVRVPLPFSPVPLTGQTLGVMLAGALLGSRLGGASQAVYVLMGAVGLPVFAGGTGGLGILVGPTGGYLVGHILGAWTIGRLLESRPHHGMAWTVAALILGGIAAVYVPGVVQLSLVTGMELMEALALGAIPFIVGDLVKVAVGTLLVQRVQALVRAGAMGQASG